MKQTMSLSESTWCPKFHDFTLYAECYKISNTSRLPERSRQTQKTLIRLLSKKHSDKVFPIYYAGKHFVNSSP